MVHNGIITNFQVLKKSLINHGFDFESDTDTEVIPKLAKFVYDKLMEGQRSAAEMANGTTTRGGDETDKKPAGEGLRVGGGGWGWGRGRAERHQRTYRGCIVQTCDSIFDVRFC